MFGVQPPEPRISVYFRLMLKAYNFLASWQLFPEKANYELGERPKSGFYKISSDEGEKTLHVQRSWVNLENQAFESEFSIEADADIQPYIHHDWADQVKLVFVDSIQFDIFFYKNSAEVLHVQHEIQPNGYLKLVEKGHKPDGSPYTNTEIYHKQLSVLPYSASVAGAVIRPTEEGMIRHTALKAMEEQTNMQLGQIRQQIELLALQAQEIHKRKELSMMIYNTKLNFKPNIGQTYYLYEKKDGSALLSLVSPKEWGASGPFSRFIAAVKLLADHTWVEV